MTTKCISQETIATLAESLRILRSGVLDRPRDETEIAQCVHALECVRLVANIQAYRTLPELNLEGVGRRTVEERDYWIAQLMLEVRRLRAIRDTLVAGVP